MARLADWNLMDHSVRCTFAAGDLRAHAQLILEELPEQLKDIIGLYIYDSTEAAAVDKVRRVLSEFFEGGHWESSLLPARNDFHWAELMNAAEEARRALILNGLPAWREDSSHTLQEKSF
jgi:hypothetical protein